MFPRTVLKVVPSGEERYYLTTFNTGVFTLKLRLPPDTWCDQCILQWTYTAGNNWGNCDEKDREGGGASALGCGPQVPLWILEIVVLGFGQCTHGSLLGVWIFYWANRFLLDLIFFVLWFLLIGSFVHIDPRLNILDLFQENFRACADISIAGLPAKTAPFHFNPSK